MSAAGGDQLERLRGPMLGLGAELSRWVVAILVGLVGFSLFVLIVGADPIVAIEAMWNATVIDSIGPGEVLVAAAPIVLTALAVAVPARAGLWNLGGGGQLVLGVVGATMASMLIPAGLPGPLAITALAVGGAVGGALWAGIAGVLRVTVGLNEAIASLLLSYVGLRVLDYLVHGPWKDAASLGFPQAEPLPDSHRLPLIGDGRLHAGIVLAVVALAIVVFLLGRTRWGFRLGVVGGNPEAGRRAGLRVRLLLLGAMLVGGGLAGLAGMVQLAGVEFQARPEVAGVWAFLGFLVSWMARHNPLGILVASLAIGALVVGGDALQINADLPGASVKILMALLLLAILARGRTKAIGA